MLSVGLTGGIATGKTAVLENLATLGAEVLSADDIVHELLARDKEVQAKVVAAFGTECLRADGGLDRLCLARVVFDDPARRRELEGILHPPVISRIRDWRGKMERSGAGIAVVEVPLLFEASLEGMFDVTVVVSSEHATQAHRLKNRGMTPEHAAARISAQMPLASKEELADFVLRNDGSLDDLNRRVRDLWDELVTRCGTPRT